MRIDPKVEDPTRTMLDHVLKDKLEEIPKVVEKIGDARFRECIGLCVTISGYIAVDVLGPEWPTEAGLRELAKGVARAQINVELDEAQVFDFLRKSAVGFQRVDDVFPSGREIAVLPIVMTAALMLAFHPQSKKVWAYLDDIEEALELSDSVKPETLPAMILRAHRAEAAKAR